VKWERIWRKRICTRF